MLLHKEIKMPHNFFTQTPNNGLNERDTEQIGEKSCCGTAKNALSSGLNFTKNSLKKLPKGIHVFAIYLFVFLHDFEKNDPHTLEHAQNPNYQNPNNIKYFFGACLTLGLLVKVFGTLILKEPEEHEEHDTRARIDKR
jgi:hypothetical protein